MSHWGFMGTQENAFNYDKGVLADILEPIMGKGLIPADLETWKPRRRAIVPAFHKAYLEASVRMFATCTLRTVQKLEQLCASGPVRSRALPPPQSGTALLGAVRDWLTRLLAWIKQLKASGVCGGREWDGGGWGRHRCRG